MEFDDIKPIDIDSKYLDDESWLLQKSQFLKIISKLKKYPNLNDGIAKCWYGIITGNDKAFMFDKNNLDNIQIEKEVLLPLIRAQDCIRYGYSEFSKYIIYPYKLVDGKTVLLLEEEIKKNYPKLYEHFSNNKKILQNRKDSRKTFKDKQNWYSLTRFGQLDIFNKEKIVFPGETKNNRFGLDISCSGYSGARVFSITSESPDISIKYLLTILNSHIVEAYLHSIAPLKQGGYYSYSANYIHKIPIPKIDLKYQLPFIEKADKLLLLNNGLLKEKNSFKDWLMHTFNIEKLSQKLEKYYELSFDDFLNEVKKKKVDVKSRENYQTLKQEFEKSIGIIKPLLKEIEETDNEIDQMVYDLYGLTPEEIKIIEESLNSN